MSTIVNFQSADSLQSIKCRNCGRGSHVTRGSYHFRESGLSDVILDGVAIVCCDHCGEEHAMLPQMKDVMRLLALAVMSKPYRLKGEDVRFLRKYLRMTGVEFSRFLDVDKTTLSKWENNSYPIGEQSDRLIRVLAVALGTGLTEDLQEIVHMLPRIGASPDPLGIEINLEMMSYRYTRAESYAGQAQAAGD